MFVINGVKFFNNQKKLSETFALSSQGKEGCKKARHLLTKYLDSKLKELDGKKVVTGTKFITSEKVQGVDTNLEPNNRVVLIQDDTNKIVDRGYESLYRDVDMTPAGSPRNLEILDVTTQFSFGVILENEEVRISPLPSSSVAILSFLNIAGGVNIPDDWLRFNEFYKLEELVSGILRIYENRKATLAYGVITDLTGVDEAFVTDDITTINNAMKNILDNMEADGSLIAETSPYFILTNRANLNRVQKAVRSTFILPNDNNSSTQLTYPPSGVVQSTKIPAGNLWVVVPGLQNIHGNWKNLGMEEERDIQKFGTTKVWLSKQNWGIFNANQIRKLALS